MSDQLRVSVKGFVPKPDGSFVKKHKVVKDYAYSLVNVDVGGELMEAELTVHTSKFPHWEEIGPGAILDGARWGKNDGVGKFGRREIYVGDRTSLIKNGETFEAQTSGPASSRAYSGPRRAASAMPAAPASSSRALYLNEEQMIDKAIKSISGYIHKYVDSQLTIYEHRIAKRWDPAANGGQGGLVDQVVEVPLVVDGVIARRKMTADMLNMGINLIREHAIKFNNEIKDYLTEKPEKEPKAQEATQQSVTYGIAPPAADDDFLDELNNMSDDI